MAYVRSAVEGQPIRDNSRAHCFLSKVCTEKSTAGCEYYEEDTDCLSNIDSAVLSLSLSDHKQC